MSEAAVTTKWWNRKILRIPVWIWIVVIFIGVPTVLGQSGNSTEQTNVEQSQGTSSATTPTSALPATTAESTPSMTKSQENAVRAAKLYLETMGFSRQGLIDQLSSDFGDKYSVSDATFAVDSLTVDWNAEAVESANDYLATMSFSCDGLVDQLSSDFGSKFTRKQATYAASQVGLC